MQPRANGSFVRPGLDDPRQGVLTLPPLDAACSITGKGDERRVKK